MEAFAGYRDWLRNRRNWSRGVFLAVAGLLLAYTTMADGVSDSMNQLNEAKRAQGIKLALVTQEEQIKKRMSVQRASADELEKQLLPEAEVSEFAQESVRAAQSVGCSVSLVRPLALRPLPRPGDSEKDARKKKPPTVEFVEWPLLLDLRAEYGQLNRFLGLLFENERRVGIKSLTVNPLPDNRKLLACSLEIVCYGLVEPDKEKQP